MAASFLKKSIPYLYLGGGAVAGLAVLYPNTLGLDHYKDLMAIRTPEGKEEEVDMDILKMAEEIADKLEWTKEQKENMRLFPCIWIDFVHMGNYNSRWGASVGVPGYLVSSLKLIDNMTYSGKLGNFTIDWALPEGQSLQKSFRMVDNAKKFSLAKEMCEVESNHNVYIAGATAATVPGAYYITKLFQMVTGFYRSGVLKVVSYALVFPTVLLSYIFLKDAYHCQRQEKIDDRLASLGLDMAQCGADYYSAVLMRNQALLYLCGKAGASYISCYGNSKSIWRRPEPLLTERRDKMIKFVEKGHNLK